MTVELKGCALALLAAAAAAGCNNNDTTSTVDAPPTVTFERFTSHEWSLSSINNELQLTISDTPGPTACQLSVDQHNALTGMGVEIIAHLPGPTDGTPCPTGEYTINGTDAGCSRSAGTAAFVPSACAFYVAYDASGKALGNTPALNGVIKLSGDANECAIEATVGFLGASFTEMADLTPAAPASGPWCIDN